MKERPIIFSGPMVRAILDGRKTQTRRVIKPQPEGMENTRGYATYFCPYGIPGDRLWVRETWQNVADMNICHPADSYVVYRATDPDWETMEGWRWRPSIYMPREASRITLDIIGVRVERVQDISWQDIMAEGVHTGTVMGVPNPENPVWVENVTGEFAKLWDSINAKRGYGWSENHLVWVIEFKQAEGEGKQHGK